MKKVLTYDQASKLYIDTRNRIDDVNSHVSEVVDVKLEAYDTKFTEINNSIEGVDSRIDTEMEAVDTRFGEFDEKKLENDDIDVITSDDILTIVNDVYGVNVSVNFDDINAGDDYSSKIVIGYTKG